MSKKKSKEKPLKIGADGTSKAVLRADSHSANKRKIRFDEDGDAVEEEGISIFDQAAEETEAANTKKGAKRNKVDQQVVDDYTRSVKQRVDASRDDDNLRERERVKAKRQKLKESIRGKRDGGGGDSDSDDSDAMDVGAGAVLGGYKGKLGHNGDSDGNDSDSSFDDAAYLEQKAMAMLE